MSQFTQRVITGTILLGLLWALLFVLPSMWVWGSLALIGVLAMHELWRLYQQGASNVGIRTTLFSACIGYALFLWAAIGAMGLLYQKSPWLAATMFAIVIGMDIGGYFTGKACGKTKLCPNISPGKSVEGALGGLMFVLVGTCLAITQQSLPWLSTLGVALTTAVFAVLGDLLESWIKRLANVKDSGTLLPGHGGILDRIDGVILAAPIFYYGIIAF